MAFALALLCAQLFQGLLVFILQAKLQCLCLKEEPSIHKPSFFILSQNIVFFMPFIATIGLFNSSF